MHDFGLDAPGDFLTVYRYIDGSAYQREREVFCAGRNGPFGQGDARQPGIAGPEREPLRAGLGQADDQADEQGDEQADEPFDDIDEPG